MDTRNPELDACDKEIAATLQKFGKTIRPVPFIDPEGRVGAQIVYFDVDKTTTEETPKAEEPTVAESPLEV